jgi:hypothetical protein
VQPKATALRACVIAFGLRAFFALAGDQLLRVPCVALTDFLSGTTSVKAMPSALLCLLRSPVMRWPRGRSGRVS